MATKTKTTNFAAKNVRLIKEAEAKRAKIEAEAAAKALADAQKQSNQPTHTVDQCIHDILASTRDAEAAGSALVVAIFNDTDRWSLASLTIYFAAKSSQSVTQADGTKKIDKSVATRPKMLAAFLSLNDEYKAAVDAIEKTKAELKDTEKKKPVDAVRVAELDAKIDDDMKPIKAVEAKLHRAFIAAYQCRIAGYINVTIGTSNRLMVTMPDGKVKQFTETTIRDAGTDELKKLGHIVSKKRKTKTPEGTNNKPPAVDATTAKIVLDGLNTLLDNEDFKPPIDAGETVTITDQNDLAETALRMVRKLSRETVNKNVDLKETVSELIVELIAFVKVNEAQSIVKKLGVDRAA